MVAIVFTGQGSQHRGMGRELFRRHPRLTRAAEQQLGYSLAELVESERLDQTQYTQPALFVVNALVYLEWREGSGERPRFAAGHSLGEYNALHAAGVIDFELGVRLVAERGRLMAAAGAGKMAAGVFGWTAAQVREALARLGAAGVDLASDNSPTQQVIAGSSTSSPRIAAQLEQLRAKVVELRVKTAFHSRYMQDAAARFARILAGVESRPPTFPVISNVEARPYERGREAELLGRQIAAAVRWTASVRYTLEAGEARFEEIGPTPTLSKLIEQTRASVERSKFAPAPKPETKLALRSTITPPLARACPRATFSAASLSMPPRSAASSFTAATACATPTWPGPCTRASARGSASAAATPARPSSTPCGSSSSRAATRSPSPRRALRLPALLRRAARARADRPQVGRLPRRDRSLRSRVVRGRAPAGPLHGSTGAAVPRAGLGLRRGRRLQPPGPGRRAGEYQGSPGPRRRVRGRQLQRVRGFGGRAQRPRARPRPRADALQHPELLGRQSSVLRPRPRRPEHDRRHGLLVFAQRRAPGL